MPEISIKLYKGRTEEQKKLFLAKVVEAVGDHLTMPGTPRLTDENVKFSITEMDRPNPSGKAA
jgi:hypothetical protein